MSVTIPHTRMSQAQQDTGNCHDRRPGPTDFRTNLRDFNQEELIRHCRARGLAAYRGRQIFAWLYRPGIASFEQMTDLPRELRQRLATTSTMTIPTVVDTKISRDGTRKFAFLLDDDAVIESVLIPEEDRQTLCISSQVGCAMGCRFCMTGSLGFTRNLRPSEIVGQVLAVRDLLAGKEGPPLTNIVFMGMGEPLANFDHCITTLDILTDQRGPDFSPRRITVSTCGLAPKIIELGRSSKVNLAISLHAASNTVRDRLMPVNRTYPIEEVLAACRDFPMPRRKRIMIEYIVMAGINDSTEDARQLARILRGIPCKINLLPYNAMPGFPFRSPDMAQVQKFQDILWKNGYTVLIRTSRGSDIAAACGQLAGRIREGQQEPQSDQ